MAGELKTLPLGNGAYESESLPVSAQMCVNLYPSTPDVPALSPVVHFGTPGIVEVANTGATISDINRGAHNMSGIGYFVNGGNLYRLNSDESTDNLGAISGSGRVSMADNGTQLMILVPGGAGYIFTEPATLTTITDTNFTANGNPQYVVFIDGYFLFTTDENKFIISALNDGLTYSALDFGTAESSPDGVVVPIKFKNQLFIGGEVTTEGFTNIGGTEFPFQRSGLFLDKGVKAPFSVGNAENTFLFLGNGKDEEPAIYSIVGNATTKVSTQAIDSILQRLTEEELADVFTWTYGQAGHFFIGFNLPDTCVVYDTATMRWHERKSQIEAIDGTPETERWRVTSLVSVYGKLYVGDAKDGRIGRLDVDVYTEYGGEFVSAVSTQPYSNHMNPFTVPYLELTVESGVGNADAPEPKVWLQVSRDGGKTWTDPRIREIGKVGAYEQRAVWRRNGRTDRFDVYRFGISDPIKRVIISLQADIRGL